MIPITHILCAVDFSDTSHHALRHAAALAAWFRARLTVLHVASSPSDTFLPAAAPGDWAPALSLTPPLDQVREELAREVTRVGADPVAPDLTVAVGRPHEVILAEALARGADLLVVGTHGRSGFHRLVLGSVAEKVLRLSPCPVLTVPPHAAGGVAVPSYRQILCPIDFSASSRRALTLAVELAHEAGGHVTVLHALEYLDPEEPCEHVPIDIRAYRAHLLTHVRQRLHEAVTASGADAETVTEALAVNRAYQEILDRAASLPADLIVMGTQGHGGIELMLYGSNTQQVVRRATCPVLAVRG